MSALKGKRKEYLTVKDLQRVLDSCKLHLNQIDEVWPNIYIGNVAVAQNKAALLKLGITHVLNAAHSKRGSIGNQSFYGNDFVYCGIPADDSTHFDLDVYFQPAADFIHKALKSPDGKVLVHCIMGMSRSSTLVLAYLMIYRHLSLKQALQKLIQKRAIYPNKNFLALLLDLDLQLTRKKKTSLQRDLEKATFPAKTNHIQKAKQGSVIHKTTKKRPGGGCKSRSEASRHAQRPQLPGEP
ncbi:dual specificity protein phosphatase 13-like isoform X1 [Lates japonicus]|uniref:Dual specificity protein phosphatase 13-like isoform X1 n=1 Tax=Lates japonicus TaxID=270547 RepID=A0AAD3MXA5_LATJO|nr:dual specificity protein phosphatase 13-like isoform X1 [Lates japonicus]